MAKIIELLTVNIAVDSLDEGVHLYEKLGVPHVAPDVMPEPPVEITDVSFPFERGGGLSVIAATAPSSPVARFLEKRGSGPYSIAVRVDNIREIMQEWQGRGLEWVLAEPVVLENGKAVQWEVEHLLLNWVKPKSLGGVLLEVFEFQGRVRNVMDEKESAS